MYANASVIGLSRISNHVPIGANMFCKMKKMSDNSIEYGRSPGIKVYHCTVEDIENRIVRIWKHIKEMNSG